MISEKFYSLCNSLAQGGDNFANKSIISEINQQIELLPEFEIMQRIMNLKIIYLNV